jgi:hypothetical protein
MESVHADIESVNADDECFNVDKESYAPISSPSTPI